MHFRRVSRLGRSVEIRQAILVIRAGFTTLLL